MSPLFFILLYHLTYTAATNNVTYVNNRHLLSFMPIQNDEKKVEAPAEEPKEGAITIHIKNEEKIKAQPAVPPAEAPPESDKKSITKESERNLTQIEDRKIINSTEMESGALLRGVSVIVILTALVIVYMALKTYCG